MHLFDDPDIRQAVDQAEARRRFEATRYRGEPAEPARQANLFDDLHWKPDQLGLFDVNARNEGEFAE